MGEINEGHRHQRGKKERVDQRSKRETELMQNEKVSETMNEFHQRIAPGNGGPARSASSPQKEKAQERNVVIRPNRFLTGRTVGRGKDDRLSPRHTINADIDKTADEQSENKNNCFYHEGHPCRG